ncbi:hypothetical protein NDU88_005721 [Pleurodeles waltl]|uniref:Uncharacterized protein n=1 Tax=Pleurodeles waltl TaxID=8319 RepID=A0AAV7WC89_PLEWA|nr:hypothetical protein NDU88_005721 [Pleurodeles waltl]
MPNADIQKQLTIELKFGRSPEQAWRRRNCVPAVPPTRESEDTAAAAERPNKRQIMPNSTRVSLPQFCLPGGLKVLRPAAERPNKRQK